MRRCAYERDYAKYLRDLQNVLSQLETECVEYFGWRISLKCVKGRILMCILMSQCWCFVYNCSGLFVCVCVFYASHYYYYYSSTFDWISIQSIWWDVSNNFHIFVQSYRIKSIILIIVILEFCHKLSHWSIFIFAVFVFFLLLNFFTLTKENFTSVFPIYCGFESF